MTENSTMMMMMSVYLIDNITYSQIYSIKDWFYNLDLVFLGLVASKLHHIPSYCL